MARFILACGLLALATFAAGEARPCGECARVGRPWHRVTGKLTLLALEAGDRYSVRPGLDKEDVINFPPRGRVAVIGWRLTTDDGKTYVLNLGSRTLTRRAAELDGKRVTVAGPLDKDTIDVWELDAAR